MAGRERLVDDEAPSEEQADGPPHGVVPAQRRWLSCRPEHLSDQVLRAVVGPPAPLWNNKMGWNIWRRQIAALRLKNVQSDSHPPSSSQETQHSRVMKGKGGYRGAPHDVSSGSGNGRLRNAHKGFKGKGMGSFGGVSNSNSKSNQVSARSGSNNEGVPRAIDSGAKARRAAAERRRQSEAGDSCREQNRVRKADWRRRQGLKHDATEGGVTRGPPVIWLPCRPCDVGGLLEFLGGCGVTPEVAPFSWARSEEPLSALRLVRPGFELGDLHEWTPVEGRARLLKFLRDNMKHGCEERVVEGKGRSRREFRLVKGTLAKVQESLERLGVRRPLETDYGEAMLWFFWGAGMRVVFEDVKRDGHCVSVRYKLETGGGSPQYRDGPRGRQFRFDMDGAHKAQSRMAIEVGLETVRRIRRKREELQVQAYKSMTVGSPDARRAVGGWPKKHGENAGKWLDLPFEQNEWSETRDILAGRKTWKTLVSGSDTKVKFDIPAGVVDQERGSVPSYRVLPWVAEGRERGFWKTDREAREESALRAAQASEMEEEKAEEEEEEEESTTRMSARDRQFRRTYVEEIVQGSKALEGRGEAKDSNSKPFFTVFSKPEQEFRRHAKNSWGFEQVWSSPRRATEKDQFPGSLGKNLWDLLLDKERITMELRACHPVRMNKEWHVIAKQLSALQTDIDAERAAVIVASASIVKIVTEDGVARERSHKKDSRRGLAESSRKDAPTGAEGGNKGETQIGANRKVQKIEPTRMPFGANIFISDGGIQRSAACPNKENERPLSTNVRTAKTGIAGGAVAKQSRRPLASNGTMTSSVEFARPIAMEGAHTAAMDFQDCASSVEFARPIAMEGAHTAFARDHQVDQFLN